MQKTTHFLYRLSSYKVTVFCLMLCVTGTVATAESAPRIGLVLGGGGARGFAHLGVLEMMERLKIPISCIAGTSAGALVGGTYASGMSLESMKSNFAHQDWARLLSGQAQRKDVPFERKREDYQNYLGVTLGLKEGKLQGPKSAINSQSIDLYIKSLTKSSYYNHFDEMPIPFRALATNLETGEAVVFSEGDLALALRSSMAVPGVFSLVDDGERYLVDGGMARQLPIREAQACADVVIVVDVSSPMYKKSDINNVLDVVAQSFNLSIATNVKSELTRMRAQDIYIKPDLGDYSAADFSQSEAIAKLGLAAMADYVEQLKRYSLPAADYDAWKLTIVEPQPPTIDRIQLASAQLNYVNPSVLNKKLMQHQNQAGKGFTERELQSKLTELFAEGDYDSLSYRLSKQEDEVVADVLPVEKSTGPTYVRFGIELEGSTDADANYAFLFNLNRTWLNAAGASWYNNLRLGKDVHLRTEFMQPWSATSPWFAAGGFALKNDVLDLYTSDHKHYADLSKSWNRAYLDTGYRLGQYGDLRLGGYVGHNTTTAKIGVPFDKISSQVFGAKTSVMIDQLDSARWPRSGYSLEADLNHEADLNDNQLSNTYGKLLANYVYTTPNEVTLRLTGSYTNDAVNYVSHGGFLRVGGLQQDEVLSEEALFGRAMVYWRAATLPSVIGSGFYLGASVEGLQIRNQVSIEETSGKLLILPHNRYYGGSVFGSADTLLGPFFLGIGYGNGGNLVGYFYLGTNF